MTEKVRQLRNILLTHEIISEESMERIEISKWKTKDVYSEIAWRLCWTIRDQQSLKEFQNQETKFIVWQVWANMVENNLIITK